VAEQQAVYEQQTAVAQAEQAKRVSVAAANATAFEGEAESEAKMADAKAKLQVAQAEAFRIGETKKREAQAAVEEAQNLAMAKAAIAEAERVEAERRAELEAPAKAQKARTIVEAEAAAAKKKLEAEAEANAIFVKLEAEAKGQFEILARKGEGLREIISAFGTAQDAFQLLMLEHLDMLASKSAEAISKIKFDKIIVWENGGNNGQSSTSNFLQGLSRSLPPMMQVMRDIGGIEVPEYLAKLTPENGDAKSAVAGSSPKPKGESVASRKSSTEEKVEKDA
jgi:flotillin